ncbi:DUF1844 domain-containing protein [Methylacidimicrobium sp. B4]|uniref:DUF1844 domain-containing protein n=1 Tax=Methylacidimicrobium sp. B4 TaxID=2796139 RepID=UPI001A8F4EE5|nr:DUF1844 domain-containing protein [Methylacidimicrobium sp. B4]QSR85604.1 DUF1844 domain-containing protein [Methylacidimicrobium sp. B4]
MHDSLSDTEVQARFARHLQMQIEHVLMLLGRIPLPGMEAMEPRLPEARELIDHLEALEVKTRGNLQPNEQAFLTGALTELRLAYVEASRNRGRVSSAPRSTSETAGAGAAEPAQAPVIGPSQPEPSTEGDKRKFFKSYG